MIGVAVLAVLLAVVWAVTAFLYRRDARAAHATIASRDRLIGEKNERLTILADALDAERSAHRATTATLDHYVYAGDRTSMVGQQVGPTTLRDYLTAVDAVYDPATDTTRVGFAFGLHEVTS